MSSRSLSPSTKLDSLDKSAAPQLTEAELEAQEKKRIDDAIKYPSIKIYPKSSRESGMWFYQTIALQETILPFAFTIDTIFTFRPSETEEFEGKLFFETKSFVTLDGTRIAADTLHHFESGDISFMMDRTLKSIRKAVKQASSVKVKDLHYQVVSEHGGKFCDLLEELFPRIEENHQIGTTDFVAKFWENMAALKEEKLKKSKGGGVS